MPGDKGEVGRRKYHQTHITPEQSKTVQERYKQKERVEQLENLRQMWRKRRGMWKTPL